MTRRISWNLGHWQQVRGIRSKDMAKALGMHPNNYWRLRNHTTQPRTQWPIILKICEVLDIDYYDLVRPLDS